MQAQLLSYRSLMLQRCLGNQLWRRGGTAPASVAGVPTGLAVSMVSNACSRQALLRQLEGSGVEVVDRRQSSSVVELVFSVAHSAGGINPDHRTFVGSLQKTNWAASVQPQPVEERGFSLLTSSKIYAAGSITAQPGG